MVNKKYYILKDLNDDKPQLWKGSLTTATQIAGALGVSVIKLNRYLVRKGFARRYNEHTLEIIDPILAKELGCYVTPSKSLINPLFEYNDKGVQYILNLIVEDLKNGGEL